MKPRASIFLEAAKRLARRRAGLDEYDSQFCCDNIQEAAEDMRKQFGDTVPELVMFAELFEPKGVAPFLPWWARGDNGLEANGHDYESRLIALLLCWAMLLPERKRRRTRKA